VGSAGSMPGVNMKLLSLVPLAAALATTTAIGQDAKPATLPLWTASLAQCPIGLTVKRGSFFVERRVADVHEGTVQRVQVNVTNPGSRKIVALGLTVHGYSSHQRAFTLGATLGSGSPDLVRNVELTLDVEGNGHASGDLTLRNFNALGWLEVTSLRYADGSEWTASRDVCRVAPDALMLVSESR
jgi:hypothetical protein